MKYACIHAHRGAFPLRLMCRVLAVSPSGFYAWRYRPVSARGRANGRLTAEIRAIHQASRRTYGSPRVQAELRAQGQAVGRKRIARLMRQAGLQGTRRRRYQATTDSAHSTPVAPNALGRRFAVAQVGAPDRVWAGDVTYVATRERWLYLAVLLDLASRRVVGWAMHETTEQVLVLRALEMALAQRRPGPGLVHHSDRGSQYASAGYQRVLAAHGMEPSMSRRANCWDNAVVESFFATLKTELLAGRVFVTRAAARSALFAYIELWYNRRRRHSTLGYRSPMQYEADVFTHVA